MFIQKPVIIPRLDVGVLRKLPFTRAYSPALSAHDITVTAFMEFIDNLTVVQAPNPVFKVADIAGMGVGFVPWHWAQLTGTSIQVVSGLGTAAVSIARTRVFLKEVNAQFFAPRGLKVSIKKDPDVVTLLGGSVPPSHVLAEFGGTTIPAPYSNAGSSTATELQEALSIPSRRMAVLAPYIATLTMDVPPPTRASNVLDRISASQTERIRRKRGEKMMKAHKKGKGWNSSSSSSSSSDSDSDSSLISIDRKIAKVDHKIAHEEAKGQKKLAKKSPSKAAEITKDMEKEIRHLESEKRKLRKESDKKEGKRSKKEAGRDARRMDKAEQRQSKKESKVAKKVSRLEYIVIENLV